MIKPLIQSTIAPGTLIYTDEQAIYDRLEPWGYSRKSVCHGAGEYARDEDGDGFYEVHVTRWRVFGRYCVPGCVLIAAFLKLICQFIWDFLSLCITQKNAAKFYYSHLTQKSYTL